MKRIILYITTALAIRLLSAVSFAETVDFKSIEDSANRGDARAQYALAKLYYNGEGVTKDLTKAVEWYQKAADQGDAKAQLSLGGLYYRGEGVAKRPSPSG